MNPFEFALVAFVILGIFSLLKARLGAHRRDPRSEAGERPSIETERLRDEVRQLRERLQTLERITVDKESSLANEIERLRDR